MNNREIAWKHVYRLAAYHLFGKSEESLTVPEQETCIAFADKVDRLSHARQSMK